MYTPDVANSLSQLSRELIDGTPRAGGYVLNRGDVGLLASLDRLSAPGASTVAPSGSSIAAHVQHMSYALSLMNRWAKGENPWASADWSASWKRTQVDDAQWQTIREELRAQTSNWMEMLKTSRTVDAADLGGLIGSVAHLAYHMGAIRQIDPMTRGPRS
jgi:hypothetical protein